VAFPAVLPLVVEPFEPLLQAAASIVMADAMSRADARRAPFDRTVRTAPLSFSAAELR
jgi:hypothetical protein